MEAATYREEVLKERADHQSNHWLTWRKEDSAHERSNEKKAKV